MYTRRSKLPIAAALAAAVIGGLASVGDAYGQAKETVTDHKWGGSPKTRGGMPTKVASKASARETRKRKAKVAKASRSKNRSR